jgi:hypothetical protein
MANNNIFMIKPSGTVICPIGGFIKHVSALLAIGLLE